MPIIISYCAITVSQDEEPQREFVRHSKTWAPLTCIICLEKQRKASEAYSQLSQQEVKTKQKKEKKSQSTFSACFLHALVARNFYVSQFFFSSFSFSLLVRLSILPSTNTCYRWTCSCIERATNLSVRRGQNDRKAENEKKRNTVSRRIV